MNTLSPPHPIEAALAAMDLKARDAETRESAAGWRHAALVARQFTSVPRALKQLRAHAGFTSSAAKAAAYRGAMTILSDATGEALPPARADLDLFPTG